MMMMMMMNRPNVYIADGTSALYDNNNVNSTSTNCSFYRAMLCICGTSHGPVSVCVRVRLSVTSRRSTKTAKRRITQRTPHDTPVSLVF